MERVRHTERKSEIQTERVRERDRQKKRKETDRWRESERQTDTQMERVREKDRGTDRDRQKERESERQTEKRHTHIVSSIQTAQAILHTWTRTCRVTAGAEPCLGVTVTLFGIRSSKKDCRVLQKKSNRK